MRRLSVILFLSGTFFLVLSGSARSTFADTDGGERGVELCANAIGDVNASGATDFTDAIAVLSHLFLGDPESLAENCAAGEISALEAALAERDADIAKLITEHEATIAAHDMALAERDADIAALIVQRDTAIAARDGLQGSLESCQTDLSKTDAERDATIAELEASKAACAVALADRDADIVALVAQRDTAIAARDGLQDSLESCQEDLGTSNSQLTTANANLATANAELTTCNTNYSSCSSDLGTANAELTTCSGDLETANVQLTTANAELATCSTNYNTCSDDLEKANAELGTCYSNFETANAELGTCYIDLETTNAQLTTANAELTTCSTNYNTCSNDLETANAQLTTANAQLGTCSDDLEKANAELGTCYSDFETANAELGTCYIDLETTNAQLTTANAKLTTCSSSLDTANAQLTAAEGNLQSTLDGLNTCQDHLQTAQENLESCDTDCSDDLSASEAALEVANARIVELESLGGCTHPEASNYSADVVYDDGSCIIPGCTDPEASNHNADANVDDESCEYPGCTNPDASNYNSNANVDDGSCQIPGCTDPEASNYNADATQDDSSCEYAEPEIPDGFSFVEKNAEGYDEYTHDASGIEFVLLPRGEFEMGSPDTEEGRFFDEAKHTVKLSPFLIAKYEVTQAEYAAVMTGNAAGLNPTPSDFEGDNRPVEQVSWFDLKHPDGFLGRTGLSLPSEAQWEYACRAGTTGPYAGNGILGDMGWYSGNSGGETHDVGGKQANDFGLHDMHGNVFEWCEDVYNENFYDSGSAYGPNPLSTGGSVFRVIRGGDFRNNAQLARSARRYGSRDRPSHRFYDVGFRPARPLP